MTDDSSSLAVLATPGTDLAVPRRGELDRQAEREWNVSGLDPDRDFWTRPVNEMITLRGQWARASVAGDEQELARLRAVYDEIERMRYAARQDALAAARAAGHAAAVRSLSMDYCPVAVSWKMPRDVPDSRGRYAGHEFYMSPEQEAWRRRHNRASQHRETEPAPMPPDESAALDAAMRAVLAARPAPRAIEPAPERAEREAERRRERDELRRMQRAGFADIPDNGSLESHLLWLWQEFGAGEFTTTKVRNVALENPDYRRPPGSFRPSDADYTKQLGLAWADHAGRVAGDMWMERSSGRTSGAWRWRVVVKDDPSGPA